jgi:glycosyltransferase involved in cell wall biosynthesis
MEKTKIILIGNYIPDSQESMIRFAEMLCKGITSSGYECQVWWPKVMFGKTFNSTTSGFKKWIGYIDKWIIFPILLRIRVRNEFKKEEKLWFHICDHSNAPYLKYLPSEHTSITCHDVIAIRTALGSLDTHEKASIFGKYLQQWILYHLLRAKRLVAVSFSTIEQLKKFDIAKNYLKSDWRVIHNALNNSFKPLTCKEAENLLVKTGFNTDKPFILHVGSNSHRKNRKMLLEMVKILGEDWSGNICYAGEPADSSLLEYSSYLGVRDRVFSVVKPEHDTLVALYSLCDAFIFPSFTEGFGWPLIEAQACGAPVIASDKEPMPEVSGGAAIHADPNDPNQFANAFLNLIKDSDIREQLIEGGIENSKRFSISKMIYSYLDLYGIVEKPQNTENKINT